MTRKKASVKRGHVHLNPCRQALQPNCFNQCNLFRSRWLSEIRSCSMPHARGCQEELLTLPKGNFFTLPRQFPDISCRFLDSAA